MYKFRQLLKTSLLLLCFAIFTFTASPVSAYYTNMNASVVVGQPDFVSNTANQGLSTPNASTINNTNRGARGILVDSMGRLLISDPTNNRVLIWNRVPTTNGAPADLVLGQPDFASSTGNNGGRSASTLSNPLGLASDGTRLFVADGLNNRILIWNALPTRTQQPADLVIGQSDMSSATAACDTIHLSSPLGITVSHGKVLVSNAVVSATSNRVLVWNVIPTTNGVAADFVIGQPNLTTCGATSTAANTLSVPEIMAVDDNGKLFITDNGNRRILIYNQIPTASNASADLVIGQKDFVSGSLQPASDSTFGTQSVAVSGNKVFVGDANTGNRVIIYNQSPGNSGQSADLVIGQSNFTNSSANQGGSTGTNGFNVVHTVYAHDNKLFVADAANFRVLIFNDTTITPNISLTTPPVNLGNGRYRLTGSIFMNNNNNTYGLQTLQADLNGVGYGSLSFNGGRTDTGGNSTYDFTYDFDPTVGLGSINNLTIKLLASTFNADTNTLFYFLPFNFQSFNVSSTKSQNFIFSVNQNQLSRIKDNLDHFEVWYKPNTTTGKWTNYISNISKTQIDTNGTVVATKTTNLTKFIGSYIFKVTAIDNWGNKEDSNYLYTAGTAPIILTSYPSFGKSFVSPVPSSTPLIQITPLPFSIIPTVTPEIVPTDSSNTNETNSTLKYYIFFGGSIILILGLLILLLKRRKKT